MPESDYLARRNPRFIEELSRDRADSNADPQPDTYHTNSSPFPFVFLLFTIYLMFIDILHKQQNIQNHEKIPRFTVA